MIQIDSFKLKPFALGSTLYALCSLPLALRFLCEPEKRNNR